METGWLPWGVGCPLGPRRILKLGDVVEVGQIGSQLLSLRTNPAGNLVEQLTSRTRLEITGGPRCAGLYSWRQVRTANNVNGWIAEGDSQQTNPYYIQLASAGRPTPKPTGTPVARATATATFTPTAVPTATN